MIKFFLTVSGWTLISRIAGLFRDLMMAAYLGTGVIAEAFQAAFSLPNLFRRFFAEGAFNLAFVPLYTKNWPLRMVVKSLLVRHYRHLQVY